MDLRNYKAFDMEIAIVTNIAAINVAAAASSAHRDMGTSMARLSSGARINSASDDAAGAAISSRLSAEIRGTGQALIDTAEGAHKEVENILQRMREVSLQAANETNNAQDRSNLQAELAPMVSEIDRVSSTTASAGKSLMSNSSTSFSFQVGSGVDQKSQIEVAISSLSAGILGLPTATSLNVTYEADGSVSAENNLSGLTDVSGGVAGSVTGPTSSGGGVNNTTDVTVYTYTDIDGFSDEAVVAFADTTSGDTSVEVNNHDYKMSFQVTGGSGAEKATELVT